MSATDVFPLPLCGSPPPPTNHPYVISYHIGKKLSKVMDNSASKPLKNKLMNYFVCMYKYRLMENCIRRRRTMYSQDTHLIF